MKKLLSLISILTLTALQDLMAQCAMCRTTIENNVSAGETALGSGLNFGILYLFVTPYLIIAVLAFLWYKKSKENAKQNTALRFTKS
ncbi:hypothetical protein OKW21_002187 [Catalinimonas alkaloidigena]|uniref:hypothetical protein n=1 Tax=Catalinimonas alkaloidigena TaxID=1075417 RepID=UPI0024049678|nr:hypothetical protein [Catalinimonas alkaloidigena]MDF9796924.1 hypothetical protein [Catalinimonas alkaloidigena]